MRRMALAIAAAVTIALVPVVTSAAPRSAGAAGGSDVRLDTKIHGKLALSDQAKREARAAPGRAVQGLLGGRRVPGRQPDLGRHDAQGMEVADADSPLDVKDWFVRLVAIDETTNQVRIGEIPLDANFDGSLSGADLDAIIGTTGSTVSAIVTFQDRSETILQTAPYTLTVNGVAQPGG